MLVLTRKTNQSIMIGDDVEVSVLSVVGEKVRIGIQAPPDVPVFRTEIYLEIQRQQGEGKPPEEARSEVDEAIQDLGERRGPAVERRDAWSSVARVPSTPRSLRPSPCLLSDRPRASVGFSPAAGTACGTWRR